MKEQVTKFNLEAAFKALNDIEIPAVAGVKPNKDNHKELVESMRPTPKTDCLLEDYYDISNQEDLEAAQADRSEEVAQAKLAKIEKIVDLDAETPEDIQPSYVGKTIVQCPQCMTLFYRDAADLTVSEEDPTLVNIGEKCPNCNNDSGYTVIGKVAAEESAEAPVEENELDLNFEEPVEEEQVEEVPAEEEKPAEETSEEEINLEPVEEPVEEVEEPKKEEKSEEEEEKKEESFEPHSENILAEQVENALTEATNADELSKKLKEHDEYIKVLQDEIKAEEEAIKNAKNDFIKKMHEKNLESLKDALDKAIPEEVKAEAAIEELPTAEDAAEDMTKNEAVEENKKAEVKEIKEEKCPVCGDELNGKEPCEKCQKELENKEELKDSLNESVESELAAFVAGLDEGCQKEECENCEEKELNEGTVEDNEQKLAEVEQEVMNEAAPKKAEFDFEIPEANSANFSKMLNDPVFKAFGEGLEEEKDLNEELPAEVVNAGEVAVAKLNDLADKDAEIAETEEAKVEEDSKVEEDIKVDEVKDKEKIEIEEPEVEELNDSYINSTITNYLTEVYSNVHNFEVTGCSMNNDKLIIEGIINFNSGKAKDTTFEFTKTAKNVYEGINKDLAGDDKFILECFTEDGGKMLMAEKLTYKYHIGTNLVEGLAKVSE